MRALKRRIDPAPSRTAFRLRRLWRSRAFRRAASVWAPLGALVFAATWIWTQADLRSEAEARFAELKTVVAARPEFAVRSLVITGAGPGVEAELRARLGHIVGASSMNLDAGAIRAEAEASGWVAAARVRLEAPETLRISVRERIPAAIWRLGETLTLLDRSGAKIAAATARADHAELPLIAGPGADAPAAVAEALRLTAVAAHISPRIRGFVRVGERRWDAFLQDGPEIMLPEKGAVDAMAYLVALDAGEGVLARDLTAVDLRLPNRPTLRLGPDAQRGLDAARTPKAPGEDA